MKRVGLLAFSSAASTLGLEVVADAVRREYPEWQVGAVDHTDAKEVDYLLVSLYWWRDVYAFVSFLDQIGLDPRQGKPVIVIGGMSAVNPLPLTGYYHHAVVGDGEDVIGPLLRALESDTDPSSIQGVWNRTGCSLATASHLPAKAYTEIRTNKVTRIEIARGCKMGCAFCQLAAMKPYRENPFPVVKQLVLQAPTKTVALFAPDRATYSRYDDLEKLLARLGKRNSGSDVRLTKILRYQKASMVRFGVEAFSAAGRRAIGKPMSNDTLLRHLMHISSNITTQTGKPLTSATCYMIGDLPCEDHRALPEFWDVLQRWADTLTQRFTLFLSVSSFTPSPFTRYERTRINPYSDFNRHFMATRPRFDKLIIASRGALIGPAPRLAQMLTIRGDESCKRAVYHLATKERKLLMDRSESAGKRFEKIVKASGYDPTWLSDEWPADRSLPWQHVERPWVHAIRPHLPTT